MRILSLVLAVVAVATAERKRYDGYQLYSVFPSDESQTTYVQEQQGDVEIDFWYEGPDRFDILVPPHKIGSFLHDMTSHNIRFEVVEQDIQQNIDEEIRAMAERQAKKPAGMIIDYDTFNTLDDIFREMDDLVTRCPSGYTCATFNIGASVQNRQLRGLSIRQGTGRRGIWFDATIHAREWLATATILKIMRHFIYDASDATVARFLRTYDFWFLPVVNPDGYTYTHSNERLWRKSRNTNAGSTCIGTDLNRNFAQMWSNAGSSTNPCSETYHGSSAASEPETRALQSALQSRGASLLFSVHFHTYGYLWLIPWGSVVSGNNCNIATDHADMMVVANAAANAVQATYGTNTWARGNSCATIYPASGITMDYTKGVAGVKYTYTPELRGNNFIIAANQIEPSYREVWNGIVATINTLERLEDEK